MGDFSIEPQAVVLLVEDYVRSEISDAEKFSNREPLDESGVFSLHRLAASIYASGFRDGDASASERARGVRRREEGK
jgi:hypothetical protein